MRRHAVVGLALLGGLAAACLSAYAWVPIRAHVTATVASLTPLSVTTPVAGSGLYPGKTENVTLSIHNPNGFPVLVTNISAGSSSAFISNGLTCAAATVTSAARSASSGLLQSDGVTQKLGAGSTGQYLVSVSMAANQIGSGCAGTAFSLPVTATAVETR
jgi:hypothetical protein